MKRWSSFKRHSYYIVLDILSLPTKATKATKASGCFVNGDTGALTKSSIDIMPISTMAGMDAAKIRNMTSEKANCNGMSFV
jgi:hypothetical protein